MKEQSRLVTSVAPDQMLRAGHGFPQRAPGEMSWFQDAHLFVHSRVHSFNLAELLPREHAQYEAPGIGDRSISPLLQGPLV